MTLRRRQSTLACALLTWGMLLWGCSGIRIERPIQLRDGDWSTFAGSAARTGVAAKEIVPPLTQEWEFDVSGGIGNGSPLLVDSLMVVGNMRGELYAVNGLTGKRIGWTKLGEAIQGAPVIDGSVAYVAVSNSDESLLAFDFRSGKVRWRHDYGDMEVSPLLLKGRLYAGNIAGTFYCLEPAGGEVLWKFEIPDNRMRKGFRSSPAGENDTIYAFNADNGAVQWKFKADAAVVATPSIANGMVFVGDLDGTMYGIDLADGSLEWRFDSGSPIYGNGAVKADTLLFGNLSGQLTALRTGTGVTLWQTSLESPISSGGAVAGSYLYVGTLKKFLFAIRIVDGSVAWKQELDGRIKTSPAAAHGKLFVATDEWVVFSFRGTAQ
jgi:eukaryotic-like serine/threonine-protein kinase